MIGSFKDIENIFSELVKDDGVLINSTPTSIEYTIQTRFKYVIVVNHELTSSMYSVIIRYQNKKEYEISIYQNFKEYIKKHTKKLFGKKDITLHLKAINSFICENSDVFFETDTMDVFFGSQIRGFGKILI